MAQFHIDIHKKYKIPTTYRIVIHNEHILVIVPETANWIVLESRNQLNVFNYFQEGNSIEHALACKDFSDYDVNYVVTQLEARRLCTKNVHNSIDDERSMHLYLTNKCNLLCPHCYMHSGLAKNDELTTTEIVSLISNYRNIAHGQRITISGGEPTIHPDFDYILDVASQLGLEIKILTNGALLSRDRIKKISKYINSVQISIDGYSEDSNSIIRGKDHFTKALSSIDEFLNNGVETSVAITPPFEILKNNVKDYIKFAKHLYDKYSNKPFNVKFTDKLSKGREINLSDEQNDIYTSYIKEYSTPQYSTSG